MFQAMYAQIREYDDRNGLVAMIIATDVGKARLRFEAEISSDEETWAKDGYLQGLIDSWLGDEENPGLTATMAEDPDNPGRGAGQGRTRTLRNRSERPPER